MVGPKDGCRFPRTWSRLPGKGFYVVLWKKKKKKEEEEENMGQESRSENGRLGLQISLSVPVMLGSSGFKDLVPKREHFHQEPQPVVTVSRLFGDEGKCINFLTLP